MFLCGSMVGFGYQYHILTRYHMSSLWTKDNMPCWVRLQVGTTKERAEEAKRQGIVEDAFTHSRRQGKTIWDDTVLAKRYRRTYTVRL